MGPLLASRPVEVRELPEPTPRPHWVTVRLRHAALNRLDAMQLATPRPRTTPGDLLRLRRRGRGRPERGAAAEPGLSPGFVGADPPSLFWGPASGGARSPSTRSSARPPTAPTRSTSVPAANIYPKPAHLSWREAAALPMAGLTAWRSLVTRGRLAEARPSSSAPPPREWIQPRSRSPSPPARGSSPSPAPTPRPPRRSPSARPQLSAEPHDLADVPDSPGPGPAAGSRSRARPHRHALEPFVRHSPSRWRLVAVGRMAAPEARLRRPVGLLEAGRRPGLLDG